MLGATNIHPQILSITLDSMINRLQPVESVLEKNIESPAEQVTLIVHSSVLICQYLAFISLLLRNLPAFNTRTSFNKVMVGTIVRDKLFMGALFCNTSISKEENLVSFLNC